MKMSVIQQKLANFDLKNDPLNQSDLSQQDG